MDREVIAFRNHLIHGYDTVDSEIGGGVIEHKFSELEEAARRSSANHRNGVFGRVRTDDVLLGFRRSPASRLLAMVRGVRMIAMPLE